jgi:hypothetical protein
VRGNSRVDSSAARSDPDPDATQPQDGPAAPTAEAAATRSADRPAARSARLAKLAGTHALVAVVALALFAAADSWNTVTGLGIAGLLCIVTAVLAGVALPTLVHEWFHYLGARFAAAAFDIPSRQGLFVFNWDFGSNSVKQFYIMSAAGTVGSVLAVILLWSAVPADSWGRAVLHGAALASLVYSALIEWPVIRRVRRGGEPLAELSKIDKPLLRRSFYIATAAGIATAFIAVS